MKKTETGKLEEKKLWCRLQELNSSFAKIKENKKQNNLNKNKKLSMSYLLIVFTVRFFCLQIECSF